MSRQKPWRPELEQWLETAELSPFQLSRRAGVQRDRLNRLLGRRRDLKPGHVPTFAFDFLERVSRATGISVGVLVEDAIRVNREQAAE